MAYENSRTGELLLALETKDSEIANLREQLEKEIAECNEQVKVVIKLADSLERNQIVLDTLARRAQTFIETGDTRDANSLIDALTQYKHLRFAEFGDTSQLHF